MSEPPPPGAEEEPLPPGAEEDQDELSLRLAKSDAELNVIPASSTSEPGAAVAVTSDGTPAVSGVATSAAGAAQVADPYAGYPGYDPNAAQYDYSAYYAQYGYSQAGYYPGYTGYEGYYYDPAAYAAYAQQAAASSAQPAATEPSPALAPPSTSAAASEQLPAGDALKTEDSVNAEEVQEQVQASKAEEEERRRAEEERVKAAQAAAEEATRAAAEEAARQAEEQRRLAEEAAVRAQNLAAQRAQAEQARVGPTPEVLERIQKELAEAQEAAAKRKAAEEAAAAEAQAKAAAAAEAAAAAQGPAKKKPAAQNIMLKGARMAFSTTSGIMQMGNRIPLSKVFAEPTEAENGEPEPAEVKEKPRSNDRAGKLYMPEPLSRANVALHAEYKPPQTKPFSRSPYNQKSRSFSRSRSRGRSYSRSPSRGRTPSRSPSYRSPARSPQKRNGRQPGYSSPSPQRSPSPAEARGRIVRDDRRQFRGPPVRQPERYEAGPGMVHIPVVAPPLVPAPVAPVYAQPEADYDDKRGRREKKKHKRRHRDAASDGPAYGQPEAGVAAQGYPAEDRQERKHRHKRHRHPQPNYDDEDMDEPAVPAPVQVPAMENRQPVLQQRPRASPVQAAPPREPAVEIERVPSPPRIADLRRKYGAKGGPLSFLTQPRPRSPSSSPSPSPPPPATQPAPRLAAAAAPVPDAVTGFQRPALDLALGSGSASQPAAPLAPQPAALPPTSSKLPAQVREAAEAAAAAARAQEQQSWQESLDAAPVQQRAAGIPVVTSAQGAKRAAVDEQPGYVEDGRALKKQRFEEGGLSDSYEDSRAREKREKKKRRKEKKLKKEKARGERRVAAQPRPPPQSAYQPQFHGHDDRASGPNQRATAPEQRATAPERRLPPPARKRSPSASWSSRSRSRSFSGRSPASASPSPTPERVARARSPVIPKRMRMDEEPLRPLAAEVNKAAEAARRAASRSSQEASRAACKVYVGGLPPGYSEKNVEVMFNQIMAAAGSMTPVVSVYLNHEKRFAFVEFSTPEEATKALALDNLRYAGSTLKVRRPHDYVPTDAPIPPPASAAPAKPLFPVAQPAADVQPATTPNRPPAPTPAVVTRSRVLRLANMIAKEDLVDDNEYEDIVDDISEEVERKYGKLTSVEVPRPQRGGPDPPGVGLVFLAFETERSAQKAQTALNGRKFGENTVVSAYFEEAMFARKEFA